MRPFGPTNETKLANETKLNAKNFSVVKPLNSGEAVASPASPIPPPLSTAIYYNYLVQITSTT